MAIALKTALSDQVRQAAHGAGLEVVEAADASGFNGSATELFTLVPAAAASHTVMVEPSGAYVPGPHATLELSAGFDVQHHDFQRPLHDFLLETANRLRNPRPDLYVTLGGLPISLGEWRWPFHLSTSGADSYIVHGMAYLEDGTATADTRLRAKVSANMTVTFAEVVPAPEQPFAEGFIYNAVRKIFDQGQLELVKSGNRQPVPVTTRYYSAKQGRFIFNDTDAEQRAEFLASKVYWCSGVFGGNAPVWVADPRDAQYLNTTATDLQQTAQALASKGLLTVQADGFATGTEALMDRHAEYKARLAEALAFTRPTFNEEMRSGQTNM